MLLYTLQVESPLGPIGLVAGDDGLHAVQMGPGGPQEEEWLRRSYPGVRFVPEPHPVLRQAAAELAAYFGGRTRQFATPLVLRGTPYQVRVWQAAGRIPYGQVATYGDLARELRSGPRAVGGAMARCPLPIFVPCHRVVAAGGLGGYGGAERHKRWLLELEGVRNFSAGAG